MSRHKVGQAALEGGVEVMTAWETFLAGDGVPVNAVRRMVEDSWRRSLESGVNPSRISAPRAVDDDGLHSLRKRCNELIEAARPVMAQAREFLVESGTVMVLTDPTGVILWTEGDTGAKDHAQGIQLVPGALWTEAGSGTNAIGTALATGQPVQICAAEHFVESVKQWTCSATVIHDPCDGQLLGVLDISGLSGAHNMHCLALAVTGAGRIESRLAAIEMEKRARLLDLTLNHSRRWGDGGLVVFDRRGRLVRANESGGQFLESKGLSLTSCGDLGIAAFVENPAARAPNLPEWLRREWLQSVMDRDERLGAVLAIPRSGGPATAAQPPSAGTAGGAFSGIIGASEAISKARARARQLAGLHVPVLLLGPTGAGKEVFARALHNAGQSAKGPFVPLNCGVMTRDLLASELFGYADGAFTGARRGGMAGKFEAAHGGTLFLDEIGEMPLDLQAHFLRVLEEGEVYRLGEHKPRKVSVRLVAATNRDLRAEVAAGRFRMDLFYRLAVTVLRLPALADHREDIPLLAGHFIHQAAQRHGMPEKSMAPEVLEALMAYGWPGNVRELRNVIEGMVLLSEGAALTVEDLPPELCQTEPSAAPQSKERLAPGRLIDTERDAIVSAIHAEKGNFTAAARQLGIAKSTLYEKMKRLGIDRRSLSRDD
jgi:transcriptional regulator of acetoin/glycerol metabolism